MTIEILKRQDNSDLNSLDIYLDEIGWISRLTEDEEHRLVHDLVEGRGITDSESTMQSLYARQKLIEAHLGLVVAIAKGFKINYSRIDICDIVQAGNEGLIEGVDRFQPEMGTRVATYVSYWINKRMIETYQNNRWLIKVSDPMMRKITRKNKVESKIEKESIGQPCLQELAFAMGISLEDLGQILAAEEDVVSLDIKVGPNRTTSLGEFVPAPATSDDLPIDRELLRIRLKEILSTLSEKEAEVLKLRFRLFESEDISGVRSLQKIGDEFGLTRERIRQIIAKALRKLRHPSRAKKLRDFLE